MISWSRQTAEERSLLNPSFCGRLLWHASSAYENASQAPLPFDLAFLVLPVVLHRETRQSLPKTAKTSLAVWLDENPLSRSRVGDRARTLAPFTKDALMFGGVHELLRLKDGRITADVGWKKRIATDLKDSTDEVRTCAKRAEFVGKWFAAAGSSDTVMAMFGVRP